MAAPSNTVWGDIVGDYCRIGISVTLDTSATKVNRHVEVWFWSKYSATDTAGNTFYYDCGTDITEAKTSKGSVSIKTTVNSGAGWSTSNQQLLKEYDYEYSRGTSSVTYKIYAKLANTDIVSGSMLANTTFTIPALDKYTVSYDANGGSGEPKPQTKYYGIDLTLSTVVPTREGYKFLGWGPSPTETTVYKQPGDIYASNANFTYYAVWEIMGVMRIKQNNAWKTGITWIKTKSGWKLGIPYKKINGVWKQGGI